MEICRKIWSEREGVRDKSGRVRLDKVKSSNRGDTSRNPFEHQLRN
jgi:hypothetical protein